MSLSLDGSITQSMQSRFAALDPSTLLEWANEEFGDQLAVSTSFGIQSSVTLHLVSQVRPDIPVIWIDTGYLPAETYQYATTLTRHLNLNLHVFEAVLTPYEMESRFGRLWESDNVDELNLYDFIRKVEPMQRALKELDVRGWISGLRAQQTEFRKHLPIVKRVDDQYRIYPILDWTREDTQQYMQAHSLPSHPLWEQGYATVGDAHSSRPVSSDDASERDTRFRGKKQECGLHL